MSYGKAWLLGMGLLFVASGALAGSLRFFGTGTDDIDRVKIQIDEVGNSNPGPAVDVGATDFTVEFWVRGTQADNTAGTITCGVNNNWITGNIMFDHDRYNAPRSFGLSLGNGVVVFGVIGDDAAQRTIGCGGVDILDNAWHHIAVTRQRSDGAMAVFVDGALQDSATGAEGPDGDISYPDNATPCVNCCTERADGPDCDGSDPYIVLAAEKHDAGVSFPSFNGYLDELRISNTRRYTGNFVRPSFPFSPDVNTMGLYHFDDNGGTNARDASLQQTSQEGRLMVGGGSNGPQWSSLTPFPPVSELDVYWFQ